MITIAVPFWDANDDSLPFSRDYTEEDVEKLYRGFARNLTVPWRMVCFTEKPRTFQEPIWQERLSTTEPDYGACIEPYKLNEPMILVGLDTVITGSCDDLARYCLESKTLALPRDPFFPQMQCNGVALVPKGHGWIWDEFPGGNDMDWMRTLPCALIDNVFPGAVVSYKAHVKMHGLRDENRIVMLHGRPKLRDEELQRLDWVAEHWV